MARKYIANIRGPVGPAGPAGAGEVAVDEAVASWVIDDAPTDLKAAIEDKFQSFGAPLSSFMTTEQRADMALATPILDHTPIVQAAINAMAAQNGGEVRAAGLKLNVFGTLVIPSRVHLVMPGTTMTGVGTNVAIETGTYDAGTGVSTSNIFDYAIGGNLGPSVSRARIYGITFRNFGGDATLRLHRFLDASEVVHCDVDGATRSIFSTFSWGAVFRSNNIKKTMKLSDFVDWTTVENNSFESCNIAGIEVSGTYSLRIINNGFHFIIPGLGAAIYFTGQAFNTEIANNHFESNRRHIYGIEGAGVVRAHIHNNHLASTSINADYPITALEFFKLQDSVIELNDFVNVSVGFAGKYILSNAECKRNRVDITPAGTTGAYSEVSADMVINDSNIVRVIGGGLGWHSVVTDYAGGGQYTFEKYRTKYSWPANVIPFGSVVRTGGTHVITTDIVATGTYVDQPAYFYFNFFGATNNYRVAGRIAGRFSTAVFDCNQNLGTGGAGPTVVFSHSVGKLVITVSGLDNPSTMSGWVKGI